MLDVTRFMSSSTIRCQRDAKQSHRQDSELRFIGFVHVQITLIGGDFTSRKLIMKLDYIEQDFKVRPLLAI